MASPTRWTWVWVNSRSGWWTGRPGVLQFMGLQRVGRDWATELNWVLIVVAIIFSVLEVVFLRQLRETLNLGEMNPYWFKWSPETSSWIIFSLMKVLLRPEGEYYPLYNFHEIWVIGTVFPLRKYYITSQDLWPLEMEERQWMRSHIHWVSCQKHCRCLVIVTVAVMLQV